MSDQDNCKICGGLGEIETVIDATLDTQSVGCPACIESSKDSVIAALEKRIACAVNVPGKYDGNYPEDVMQRILTMPDAELDAFIESHPEYKP